MSPYPSHPSAGDEAWVLTETHPMQWVTLHNTKACPFYFRRYGWMIVHVHCTCIAMHTHMERGNIWPLYICQLVKWSFYTVKQSYRDFRIVWWWPTYKHIQVATVQLNVQPHYTYSKKVHEPCRKYPLWPLASVGCSIGSNFFNMKEIVHVRCSSYHIEVMKWCKISKPYSLPPSGCPLRVADSLSHCQC